MPPTLVNPLTNSPARVLALIACAGQGSRAGLKSLHGVKDVKGESGLVKQYQPINGKAMVIHTVEAFRAVRPAFDGLYMVISPDDATFEDVFPGFGAAGEQLLRVGGHTRAATVTNGLKAMLASPSQVRETDWVLVHDAARCLVTPPQIEALVRTCRHDAVGGLLASPLADTLKASVEARVASTLDRTDKWLAQTPQMFRIGMLIQALDRAAAQGLAVTDEASAIEAMGLAPMLVACSSHNFKITYPEDFALAEALLQIRSVPL